MVEKNTKIEELLSISEKELVEKYGGWGQALLRKAEMYDKIGDLSQKLVDAKNSEKSQLGDLWLCTIWDEVIEGRATDKTKKAYVDEHIREFKADCEMIQNEIDECWRNVDIINTYLKIGGIND